MKKKKWYQQKRIYAISLLFMWTVFAQTELTKMRYEPDQLAASIREQVDRPVRFAEVTVEGKRLHYVQVGNTDTLPAVIMVHGSPGALNAYDVYLVVLKMRTKKEERQ